jgi:hypothetical protein
MTYTFITTEFIAWKASLLHAVRMSICEGKAFPVVSEMAYRAVLRKSTREDWTHSQLTSVDACIHFQVCEEFTRHHGSPIPT